MKKQILKVLSVVLLVGSLNACREKEPEPEVYELGVMVLNSGNFFDNNGSVSFLKREKNDAILDLFEKENGRNFKGGVQGYAETGEHTLILIDNDKAGLDKVEIVNFGKWDSEASLGAPDIENPRAVIGISPTKAYVSCYGATGIYPNYFANPGYVAVIDLSTMKVVKKIPAQKGAEKMVKLGNDVYLGNASGADELLVIDATTDAVKRTLKIGAGPAPISPDANGKLWVQTGFSVVRLNPKTDQVEAKMRVGNDSRKSPSMFAVKPDGRGFYYVYSYYDSASGVTKGETHYFSIDATSIPGDKPIISRAFTGLGVDPLQGLIYGGVTPSYKQAGYVVRYRQDGTKLDSIKVGIAPSGFFFK